MINKHNNIQEKEWLATLTFNILNQQIHNPHIQNWHADHPFAGADF